MIYIVVGSCTGIVHHGGLKDKRLKISKCRLKGVFMSQVHVECGHGYVCLYGFFFVS